MKGIVFTLFSELVESQFGLAMWDTLIQSVKPKSEGIYTSGESYDDNELFSLVVALSHKTDIPVNDLIRKFGEYMFPELAKAYPIFVESQTSLKSFLVTVNDIIHVEVEKLYPSASLPTIQYEDTSTNELVMLYRSPRKLCYLSEGLILSAAKFFNEQIEIKHPICMHNNADHCRIEIKFI